MANARFELDLLEVTFYSWKLYVERCRVLRSVQVKYVKAANVYRLKSCFLALAVFAKQKRRKSVLYKRLATARSLHRVKKVMKQWKLYAKGNRKREDIVKLVRGRHARRKAVRVFVAWKDYVKTYYSQWVSELGTKQMQHLRKLSYFWTLHLFKLFISACHNSIRKRMNTAQSLSFYSERLRLKALLSIRLWIQRRLERQSLLLTTYEQYKHTLITKAFSALAENAFSAYTTKLVFECWKTQARERAVLRKYLQECGVEAIDPAPTKRETKSTGNSSFISEVGYELTIE